MTDDWSLKQKEKYRAPHNPADCLGAGLCYMAKDIEVLRQKIIEDFKNFCDIYSDEYNAWSGHMHKESEKIINKRFGVKQ